MKTIEWKSICIHFSRILSVHSNVSFSDSDDQAAVRHLQELIASILQDVRVQDSGCLIKSVYFKISNSGINK